MKIWGIHINFNEAGAAISEINWNQCYRTRPTRCIKADISLSQKSQQGGEKLVKLN